MTSNFFWQFFTSNKEKSCIWNGLFNTVVDLARYLSRILFLHVNNNQEKTQARNIYQFCSTFQVKFVTGPFDSIPCDQVVYTPSKYSESKRRTIVWLNPRCHRAVSHVQSPTSILNSNWISKAQRTCRIKVLTSDKEKSCIWNSLSNTIVDLARKLSSVLFRHVNNG